MIFAFCFSCQSSHEKNSPIRTIASENNETESTCDYGKVSTLEPDLNGEQIYSLSSRCVFNNSEHEVRLIMLGETFQKVLNDGCSNKDDGYGHVKELIFNGLRIENVGIKTRGNTSNCNSKRQFKFKFNSKKMFSVWQGKLQILDFPENHKRRFFGLVGFSLRSSNNDPSMIREQLSSHIFTQVNALSETTQRGPLVYRTSFAKLLVSFGRQISEGEEGTFNRRINGLFYDYKGFYTLTEHIDESFIKSRFQIADEKLPPYSLYQADLAKARFDRKSFDRQGWAVDFFEGEPPKDNKNLNQSYEHLLGFIDQLQEDATEDDLSKIIDIESLVNYTTSVILSGHWDSLLANRNNDFIFFDGGQKKWKVIAWDLDNTLGALHDQYTYLMSNDIFKPAAINGGHLFELLFSKKYPRFRAKLQERLSVCLTGFYSDKILNPFILKLKDKVKSAESWEGANDNLYAPIFAFIQARREKIKIP
jgi:spore coat protein CotH